MIQNSNISSNFNEINPNLNYRLSSFSKLSSNLTIRSSNTTELTLSLSSRQSNVINRVHDSETAQNSDHRRPESELSLCNNHRATNNFGFSSGSDETTLSNNSRNNYTAGYEEYYHKKIRAEKVMTLRKSRDMARTIENEFKLPRINEVFSQFNSVYGNGDVMQPLCVQFDSEPEIGKCAM